MTPSKTTATPPEPFTTKAGRLLCAALVALVTACGGGGGDTASAGTSGGVGGGGSRGMPPVVAGTFTCDTPPEGVQPFATVQAAVGGSIIGRTDPSFILLQAPHTVSRGFDRWLIYGPDLAQAPVITGVIYSGDGVSCNSNDRTAVNGRDWGRGGDSLYLRTEIGASGAGAALLDGGSLRYRTAPPVTYALEPRPLPGIAPNHALAPALLANAVGSWTLNDRSGVGMSLDVAADGALTLGYRGCSMKGNLRVGDGGVYTVTAWHDPAPCANWWTLNLPYEGVAVAYPLATGGWQLVFAISTNNGVDSDEVLALGRR